MVAGQPEPLPVWEILEMEPVNTLNLTAFLTCDHRQRELPKMADAFAVPVFSAIA
jgi:hypothetical protein